MYLYRVNNYQKSKRRFAMKKSLSCAELGVPGCTFEVRSELSGEVKDALLYHAQKAHADMMASLSDKEKQQLFSAIDAKLK